MGHVGVGRIFPAVVHDGVAVGAHFHTHVIGIVEGGVGFVAGEAEGGEDEDEEQAKGQGVA